MSRESIPAPAQASRRWLGGALIVTAVLVTYWPVWRGEFVWDDRLLVDKNPLVTGKLNLRTVWFQTDFPLSIVAFWLQWLAWGKSAAGYHVVNLLLHALGCLLLWRVLERLRISGAWLGAMLFALHPVCAGSVAWISELKNTLSLPLCLLSLWWYLDSEETTAARQPTGTATIRYLLSLDAFVLALLSKTTTVMLPIVLLGCAWWRRDRITARDLSRVSPYFLLSLAFGMLTIWFQTHQAMAGVSVQTENFWGRLAAAGWAIWFYLAKALLPVGLNMIYPQWTIEAGSALAYLPGLFLVVAFIWLTGSAIPSRSTAINRVSRGMLFALGCFVVLLFPMLGFFDMYFLALSRVSDHLQYLALIPVCAFLGAALAPSGNSGARADAEGGSGAPAAASADGPERAGESIADVSRTEGRWQPVAGFRGILTTVVLLCFSALTMQRAHIIARDESLWSDTLKKNPMAWTAHNNLGCLLAEKNQLVEAIGHFETSLQIHPSNGQAHANLARALALQNRLADAEAHLQQALALKPDDAEVHKVSAGVLAAQGKVVEALFHLREAIRTEPDLDTRLQYAALLFQTRNYAEAIAQYRQIVAVRPELLEPLNNLAWMLATCPDSALRDGNEAVRYAENAVRLAPAGDPIPLATLGVAYAEAGQFTNAVAAAERAIERAQAAGNVQAATLNRQLQKAYRAGKPYHEPPARSAVQGAP